MGGWTTLRRTGQRYWSRSSCERATGPSLRGGCGIPPSPGGAAGLEGHPRSQGVRSPRVAGLSRSGSACRRAGTLEGWRVDECPRARPDAAGTPSLESGVTMIRLLLADDNAYVRSSLVDLLNSGGDMTVVAECTDGDEVVEAAKRTHPDVVIVDLAMARVGG